MMMILDVLARLRRENSGLAAVEFALTAPLILGMFLGGAELTNYAITKMRVSQIALHVADNASRIGSNSLLTRPQITETQINDLLIGADLQGGTLQLATRARIIVSSVEPDPEHSGKFRVHWQRCFGAKTYTSPYPAQGADNLTGMGPTGQQVTAPAGGGVIFVEVAYDYEPLVSGRFVPNRVMKDIAAMTVRDDRDFDGDDTHATGGSGIHNTEGATPSTC